jgi:ABC-type glycerol-3-phosphate transport system substrate-binding protein
MREGLASIAVAAALASAGGTACAMSSADDIHAGCRVIGGEKLPAESGGSEELCKAIVDAIEQQAPGMHYQVEVTVLPRSRLNASITTGDGRRLADQSFVRMDKPLSSGAFKRFASAIAGELAKAGVNKS